MTSASFPPARRRLRLGLVGGGRGYIGRVHADGAKLSDRWEVVAGALSSHPAVAESAGAQITFAVRRPAAPGWCRDRSAGADFSSRT